MIYRFRLILQQKLQFYWGAKERVIHRENAVSYDFVDLSGQSVAPWVFGPFPAGMNQKFVLPDTQSIDNALLRKVNMGWVSELDLAKSPVLLGTDELLPASENNTTTLNTPNRPIDSVAVNIEEPQKVEVRRPQEPYKLIIVIESTVNTPRSGGIFIIDKFRLATKLYSFLVIS